MNESIVNYLDHFTREILVIQVGLLLIILSFLIWIYYFNKKKYNHLKHQIPATVVKSYLDSIITNSDSLKSSLFRGGGLDVDPSKIPSVLPLRNISGGENISSGVSIEQLNAKIAEISQLRSELANKNNSVLEIENKLSNSEGELKNSHSKISELEKLIAALKLAGGSGGDDSSLKAELSEVTKERDELKQRIQEYAIIEDDLANLKRLHQENEQLKRALEAKGGSIPVSAPVSAPAPEPVVAEEESEAPAIEEPSSDEAPVVAEEAAAESKDKSPDDLLSEFEKMLG